jgi:hypothetical protein
MFRLSFCFSAVRMRSHKKRLGAITINAQPPTKYSSAIRLFPRIAQRMKSGEMLLNTISSRAAFSPSPWDVAVVTRLLR